MPPKPTEIKENRQRVGQRPTKTVQQIAWETKQDEKRMKANLRPMIE